jgi:hypothetical protein
MDGLLDRLFPANPVLGLLGDESMQQQARQQGLLGLAAGLLQAGGPSRTRTNIGQALGSGLMAGQQMYQNAVNQQISQAGAMQKMQEAQRLRQQQELVRQVMPQLVTTERQQALTTGAQAADPLAALIQSAEAGTLNQPAINQAALSTLRGALDPDQFKKVLEAIKIQTEVQQPKRDIREVGGALVDISSGRPQTIMAAAPKAEPIPSEIRAAAFELGFGTSSNLTPEQYQQASRLAQTRAVERTAAGRPSVEVKTGETAANAMIKSAVERVDASQIAADAAFETRRTVSNLKPLIEEGVFSGPLSGQAATIARLASGLGITGRDTQELLNRTASTMQGLASLELEAAKAMRGQGAITEGERALIARAAGGNLAQFTSGEVKTLLNALDKVAKFRITSHQRQVKSLRDILPEESKRFADAYTTEYEIPTAQPVQSGRSKW